MAYNSWSVVFGEQPSAAKWNILGANDASFNDGTGIGTAVINSTSLKEAFFRSRFQQVTTNSQPTGLTIQHGFSFIQSDGTAAVTKAITFPTAYTTIYNVFTSILGQKASDPTSITDLSGIGISDTATVIVGASGVSITGFTAVLRDSAAPASTRNAFNWLAIGVV